MLIARAKGIFASVGVAALLAVLSFTAARWCLARGYTLYYGDAEAHLNIARRILDSRTPGPEQIGTVWLPLPHLLMIPFVMHDDWWRSGIAGVIPSAICFVLAGTFLFAAARRAYASTSAAFAVALLFALNPNMLYLQSTPMTEPLFLRRARGVAVGDAVVSRFAIRAGGDRGGGGLERRVAHALRRLVPDSVRVPVLSPDRPKEMARGAVRRAGGAGAAGVAGAQSVLLRERAGILQRPWSAMAIYRRQLAGGMAPYPGDHDWRTALQYYFAAARLTGWAAIVASGSGRSGDSP